MFHLGTTVVYMDTSGLTQQAVAVTVSAAIKSAGRSQRDIASETGIPLVTLSRRLTGHSAFLITEIGAIARALGLTASDLIRSAEQSALTVTAA